MPLCGTCCVTQPAVDSTGRSSVQELLHAVNVAERSSSSESAELPLGQWEVEALRGRADLLPPQLLMASPAQSARKLSVEALAGMADVLVMSGRWVWWGEGARLSQCGCCQAGLCEAA